MKLYQPPPPPPAPELIRIVIKNQGEKNETIFLEETDLPKAVQFVKDAIQEANFLPFAEGKKTTVVVREYCMDKDPHLGKSKSVSFYGSTPEQTKEIILAFSNFKMKVHLFFGNKNDEFTKGHFSHMNAFYDLINGNSIAGF